MYEAARVTDPIAHTSALTGFLIGAVIGIALIAAVAFATFTCGFGVALLAGLAAGLGASGILALGEGIGKMFSSPCGTILTGSSNVHTNNLQAAYVQMSMVTCANHSSPPPLIAEGSTNVFINGMPAARKNDKITCGAKIDQGSSNVFMGGGSKQYLPVEDEVPSWLRTAVDWAFALAGLVGGLAGLAKQLAKEGMELSLKAFTPCAAKFIGGFVVGEVASRYVIGPTVERAIGGLLGHPVDVTTGRKLLLAQDEVDFALPGYLPLVCARYYSSDLAQEGALGRGWVLPWELRLEARGDEIHYFDAQGREMVFPRVEPGHSIHSEAEQRSLSCTKDGRYVLHDISETYHEFSPFGPDGKAWLIRLEDQRGQWHTYERDVMGRLDAIRTSSGQHLVLQYTLSNRLTAINMQEGGTPGALVEYGYNDAGQLATVTDALGRVTRTFGYAEGRIVWHRDRLGFECRYQWADIDGTPRVVEQSTSEGERYVFQYDTAAHKTTATDELGRKAVWVFDAQRQITECTDFDGSCYGVEYSPAGHPVVLHLPGERTIKLERDELGRIIRETDPLGRVTETTYQGGGMRVIQRVFPDGGCYRAEYDMRGLLTASTDPLGRIERYEYDDIGLPHTHIDARGGRKLLKWNRRGQLVAYTDCSDKTTHYEYDIDGNLIATRDALGAQTTYTCTRTGEITSLTLPNGGTEQFEYDETGLLSRYQDAFHRERAWRYNRRGQIVTAVDPAKRELRYAYDARGRLVSLTNANGAQYRFDYDQAGRLARETRPDGIERHFSYDAAGELIRQQTFGAPPQAELRSPRSAEPLPRAVRETRLERDIIGRLIAQHTETATTAYIWNVRDQLLEAVRTPTDQGLALGISADTVTFEYDTVGRLIAEQGANGRVHYELDVLDNLAALTLPQGQRIDTLMYGSGHVHQIRMGDRVVSDFERDDLHREILRTQGRLTHRCGYDALGRRTWQAAGEIADKLGPEQGRHWRSYRFDRHGELTEQRDSVRGATLYQYDPAGQLGLRTAGKELSAEQFAWDAAGNLLDELSRRSKGFVQDNRLKVWQNLRFEYDPFGNLIEKKKGTHQTQRFRYDAEDRLLAVTTENLRGKTETRFDYDALGRRIARHETQQEIGQTGSDARTEHKRFVWQGLRLVQEIHATGVSSYLYSPEAAYTPLARIDQALAENRSSTMGHARIWHFQTDLIGTPLEVTDEAGELAWAGRYHAWGKVERNEDVLLTPRIDQPLRFPGQYADEGTGLHYNTFRYYDPDIGRFITQDPIGLMGGENLYAYAPNPTGWMDPLGWDRLPRSNGYWDGVPGESNWFSNNPEVNAVTGGKPIQFTSNRPVFSPWSKGELHFPEGVLNGTKSDFNEVYKLIAKQKGITVTAAKESLSNAKLTPHHLSTTTIELIPTDLHGNVPHTGSASDMRTAGGAKC